mmetsp:Transcript_11590/g.36688  ORF Transcript_11590/g.36688 Transcript_11590/m.36688 type:complete len:220 (-) Transcript_11590:287-946(-)
MLRGRVRLARAAARVLRRHIVAPRSDAGVLAPRSVPGAALRGRGRGGGDVCGGLPRPAVQPVLRWVLPRELCLPQVPGARGLPAHPRCHASGGDDASRAQAFGPAAALRRLRRRPRVHAGRGHHGAVLPQLATRPPQLRQRGVAFQLEPRAAAPRVRVRVGLQAAVAAQNGPARIRRAHTAGCMGGGHSPVGLPPRSGGGGGRAGIGGGGRGGGGGSGV